MHLKILATHLSVHWCRVFVCLDSTIGDQRTSYCVKLVRVPPAGRRPELRRAAAGARRALRAAYAVSCAAVLRDSLRLLDGLRASVSTCVSVDKPQGPSQQSPDNKGGEGDPHHRGGVQEKHLSFIIMVHIWFICLRATTSIISQHLRRQRIQVLHQWKEFIHRQRRTLFIGIQTLW